ncbi:glycosyl transferase group 1 [Rhodomicrobium vannielii ATCC 17100]|uniref:Glycosyl transferase group 1 n=1 Tax=Rhodomicrobium vannielii (strain ATCC 17100 / DSM 162 / LMG 4299 / NCIMB 10020 / ATH 3.1.1) TaxID=648757 RepID=E3I198_RHOVT|nr:glycosyltransferase family 4 protein [Rhodomicrobium vannielii]ADP70111.1 glycosyl transferase group 1 [Rhodomicrobium vannielii ATCC 17100]
MDVETSPASSTAGCDTKTETAPAPHPRRRCILHVTGDYPNINKPLNTLAVKNFIDANPEADHIIVTLDRTSLPWRARVTPGGGNGDSRMISIRYWGLPFGVQLAASMYLVARQTRRILQTRGEDFDVIHAHKLTFEGLAGYWLSLWFEKPLVCSLRGEVESKVLAVKPHYRFLYRRVVERSSRLYYVSAWYRPTLQKAFQPSQAKQRLLPNFVDLDGIEPHAASRPNAFVSVLCFEVYKRKGLDRLLPAFKRALEREPGITLDLVGRGSPERLAHIQSLIDKAGLGESVRLVGPLEHTELLRRLGQYSGFVLPSRNETFGMSFIEALLAGVPIVYSKGCGVDGFVDGIEAAVPVDPRSVASISDGIVRLAAHQRECRDWLLRNRDELIARFGTKNHISLYNKDVFSICHEPHSSSG